MAGGLAEGGGWLSVREMGWSEVGRSGTGGHTGPHPTGDLFLEKNRNEYPIWVREVAGLG